MSLCWKEPYEQNRGTLKSSGEAGAALYYCVDILDLASRKRLTKLKDDPVEAAILAPTRTSVSVETSLAGSGSALIEKCWQDHSSPSLPRK